MKRGILVPNTGKKHAIITVKTSLIGVPKAPLETGNPGENPYNEIAPDLITGCYLCGIRVRVSSLRAANEWRENHRKECPAE